MKRIHLWVLVLLLALVLAGSVLAQVSPNYDLGWHVLSGGGGLRSSAQVQIDDVLGQWADGLSGSENYQIDPGFWYVGREIEPRQLYLPMIFSKGP